MNTQYVPESMRCVITKTTSGQPHGHVLKFVCSILVAPDFAGLDRSKEVEVDLNVSRLNNGLASFFYCFLFLKKY